MRTSLSASDQATLLSIAHEAVCAAVNSAPAPAIDLDSLPAPLREPRASFVTLSVRGLLRGCIGTVEKCLPLAQDVILRAASAATEDPRFRPISSVELEQLSIEVSVLTDPIPLRYGDPLEIPAFLQNGVDGVIIRHGHRRATFLPQVWERVSSADQFLALLCRKALLPEDFWKTGQLQFETYQVETYHQ